MSNPFTPGNSGWMPDFEDPEMPPAKEMPSARRWMRCLARLWVWVATWVFNMLHADQRKCWRCGHVETPLMVLWSGWGNHYEFPDQCSKCCKPNVQGDGSPDTQPNQTR